MKRHRKKSVSGLVRAVLLRLFLLLLLIAGVKGLYDTFFTEKESQGRFAAPTTPSLEANTGTGDETSPITLDNDQLYSSNAILVRLTDHKILYEKNSTNKVYPASLTKIMTAIVAIENLPDLALRVTLSSDMFQRLYDEDASMAGFLPGETVPALDLLYGVLLPSGAECCVGLSEYIAGSEDAFTDLMNKKAEELGMQNTHFANTTGLNDENHYTTVCDLATLTEYALQNDTFRDIFTTSAYSTAPTSLHPDGITFYSTMFKNLDSPDIDGGSILGGKTGYTSAAGLCLASLASKNGVEYILVTAGARGNHDTEQYNIEDALFVYDSLN